MRDTSLAAASLAIAAGCGSLYAGPVFRAALVADLGWSNELAAGAFAVGYLAAGATPILSGMVADRFGPSRLLVAGLLISALGLLGAALTREPWHWFLTAGIGLSVAYYLVHVGGTLTATAGPSRGAAVGIAIGLGVGAGLGVGPVLAQWAIDRSGDAPGWRLALAAFGVGVLAVALLVGWLTRTSKPATSTVTTERPEAASKLAPEFARASIFARLRRFPRRLLVGFFVGNALLAVFDEALYQHGFGFGVARGLSEQQASWLLGAVSLVLTLGMLLGGPLSDRIGRRRVLAGAAALVLVAAVGLVRAAGEALWIWSAVYGLGLGASIAVRSAAWGDAFEGPGRGVAVGIVASGYPVGAALTIWLGAVWIDAGGTYDGLYLAAAGAAGLWGLLGALLTSPNPWLNRQGTRVVSAQGSLAVRAS